MRRPYSAEDFKKIIEAFRKRIPKITIATDVICGFPGEDEKAFRRTLKLIEDIKPDIVNVSKFFARPRTAAAKMEKDFVSPEEIKRRSSLIANLARRIALKRNQRWVGWKGKILADEAGKIPGSWVGRNFAYKPITVESGSNLLGKVLRIEVVKAFFTHLEGRLVK